MKIQKKIFLTIMVIALPTLIISGTISYFLAMDEITADILNEVDSIATIEKLRISESIDRNYERLDGILGNVQLKKNLDNYLESRNEQYKDRINEILQEEKSAIKAIKELHLINHKGEVLFSTGDNYVGKNMANTDIFRNSHYGNTINVVFDDHENSVLYVSGPMRLDNKLLGILAVETSTESLTKIIDDKISFNQLGELIISSKNVNGDGNIITPLAYADYTEVLISKQDLTSPITHALMQHQSTFTDTTDYHGEETLSSTRYIEETGWGMVVQVDKVVAFMPLVKIQQTIVLSSIVIILLALISSLIFSRSLSKPIHKLQTATKEIARGNLENKIAVSGSDELKQLALDVTEMQQNLHIAQQNMLKHERFSAIGELSSRLAHDIRSPISVIITATSLLRHKGKERTDNENQTLDMIDNATSKIKYLVENVLDFVRSREPEYQKVSLQRIFQHARKSIHGSNKIKFVLPSNDIEIFCDPNQIEVVFENLMTNSVQAIGGEQGVITITFHEENDHVLIIIQDSGPGIPENIISKIFEPLYTTKPLGTGLGLASCKSIIESHEGTITVHNNPTSFRIKLPKNPKA